MTRPEMTTGRFWAATGERAVKTAAQTAVALIGTGAVGVLDVDWQQIASVSALAAVVSVLTSLASDRLGPDRGPSLVHEPVEVPASAPKLALTGPDVGARLDPEEPLDPVAVVAAEQAPTVTLPGAGDDEPDLDALFGPDPRADK